MIERTFKIEKITPEELAEEFCDMFADQQARFFEHVWEIAKDWPGEGWCSQSFAIVKESKQRGLVDAISAIETFAAHLPEIE